MTNIYVGNLDMATTEEQLRTAFAVHGAVATVTIVLNRDTGKPRGFAFVAMTKAEEAQNAIRALNGSLLNERPLLVNEGSEKLQDFSQDLPPGARDHRRHRF